MNVQFYQNRINSIDRGIVNLERGVAASQPVTAKDGYADPKC